MNGCRRPALVAAAVAIVLTVACAYANAPSAWPARGPFIQVENWSQNPLAVAAVDGAGRRLPLGTVLKERTGCWRWPFVDAVGYLIAGTDTMYFRPWTKPGWRVDPATHILEATDGFCR